MKTKIVPLAFLSILAAAVPVSAIPIYEAFDYDPGVSTNLIGNSSPDSLQWFQSGPDSGLINQPFIEAGNLEYPARPPARGNHVRFGGNGTSARFSFKDIDVGITGTLFYSFVFRLNDVSTHNDTGFFWAGFNNTQGSQTGTPTVVGGRFVTKNDVTNNIPGNYLIGLSKNSGTAGLFSFATNSFTTNDVVFVVVAYTWIGDNADANDFSRMWINPDPSTFGTATEPEATLTNNAGGDHGNFRSFVLFNRSVNQPNDIELDELMIANNWADVTPRTNDVLAIAPKSQAVVAGNNVVFDTRSQLADSLQWQFNGTNLDGATGEMLIITNAQAVDAGTYSVVYSNLAGVSVSNATLAVRSSGGFPSYTTLWSLAPGDRPYVTVGPAGEPRQKYLAYHALSNQVLIVSMTNANTGTTDPGIYVVDATTGADSHPLNVDPNVINEGSVLLSSVDVADDGAVYAANVSDANQTGSRFKIYRWLNTDSNTVPERVFGPQEPGFSPTQHRWGDVMDVRGAGSQTEIALDENTAIYATVIKSNETFGPFWSHAIFQTKPRPTLGRSIQFGAGDSLWQKARAVQYADGGPLQNWSYMLDPGGFPTFNTTLVTNLDVFPSTLGPVAIDFSRDLLAGIDFSPVSGTPDALALYDISDLANPILISRHDFPVAHQANNNSFGRVVFAGDRIYALNANNGVLALTVSTAPVRPTLNIARSGSNVILSWTTNATGFTLRSTPSLVPTITWTDVGTGNIVGDNYVVTNDTSGSQLFFRLEQ